MDKRPLICLICEQCGKTEKMEKQELEKTLSAIKSRKMSIRTQILYLSGTCRKCEAALRKKNKGNGRLKSDAKPQ
jgi:Fe2+ or Zn2+ uptake regulation protein